VKISNIPKYSIIIPTWNHLGDCLCPCLESLFFYTDFLNDKIEVIIVANGCTDGTIEFVQNLNNDAVVLLESEEPLGYTCATNLGIKAARGEFIILMNNDVMLLGQDKSLWLRTMEEPFLKNPRMGITGVHELISPETGRSFLLFYMVMIKRELFDKLGLLDEIFNPGAGEDTDFSHKAEDAGYEILSVADQTLAPDANFYITTFPIYHRAEATVHDLSNWSEIFKRNGQTLKERYGK
jgi:GT2 family glycosyltransferase